MKHINHKIISLLLVLLLTFSFLTTAGAAGASLSGSSSVQPGNTVTLSLNLGTSGAYGFTGTISYSDNLSFSSYNCSLSGWNLVVNGKNFSAYGTSTCGNNTCVTVTFKVSSSASTGDALSASFNSLVASDGNSDISLGTASWSGTVGAAPSKDCDLSSLSCSNATLSPSFSKSTTYYTCSVDYSIDKLDLSYKTSDNGAKVSVSGNSLVVGSNTITLTVTAANGAQKTYTIVCTRAQDPNYKASTDAALSDLYLKIGEDRVSLSPTFRSTVYDYIAYVPYETTSVTYGGTPHDEKAIELTESKIQLTQEGDTPITLICTAEDGTTKQTYTIHVFRMPKYTGLLPTITFIDPEEEATKIPTLEVPAVVTLPLIGETNSLLVGAILLVVLFVLLFLLGLLIGKSSSHYEDIDEEEDTIPHKDFSQSEEPVEQVIDSSVDPYDFNQEETSSTPLEKEENASDDEYAEFVTSPEETLSNTFEPNTDDSVLLSSEECLTDEEKAAEESVKNMSFDDLLNDIRNM